MFESVLKILFNKRERYLLKNQNSFAISTSVDYRSDSISDDSSVLIGHIPKKKKYLQ